MLRSRLTGAAALIIPVLGIFFLDAQANFDRPGLWLLVISMVFVATACGELHQLFQAAQLDLGLRETILVASLAMGIAMVPVALGGNGLPPPQAWGISAWGWCGLALMTACALRLCLAMIGFEPGPKGLAELAASNFVLLYVTLPMMFLLQTRLLWQDAWGLWAMGSIIWIVKMSDAGAYFTGRFLGRTRMAPRLSPKKTWEGAVGGILLGLLASTAFFLVVRWLDPSSSLVETSPYAIALYGFALSVGGILGDLSESLLKRHAGQKDSSAWIPGLGGTLDVFDSILFAAPLGYFLWATGQVGGLRSN